MKLSHLTLQEVLSGVADKKFSMREVQTDVLQQATAQNKELNIYLDMVTEVPAEASVGVLGGVPIVLKDNILTPGLKMTASSNVLRNYQPHYEATISRRLREAGGFLFGKTNLDAWAHGSSTETSDFGPTKNPLNPQYVPGGSSGGSAAAIASNTTIAAIGTETAGSIRLPSAWCGLVGIKPTYGRVPRTGVVAMGSSLDCPGPMTKTVADGALLLEIMAGHDKYDGTSAPEAVPAFTKNLQQGIKGLKIGMMYLETIEDDAIRAVYETAMQELRQLGATVEHVTAMDPQYSVGVYAVVQRGEVSSNLARFDGIRYGEDRSHFGAEAKRRIMMGTYTLSKGYADKYYTRAQQVRTKYIQDYQRLFDEYDLLISPSAPGYALKLGESKKYPFFGEMIDRLIEPSSLAGLPGVSVPCFRDTATNLTLGLNIMAPAWQEERMLQAAFAYEQATSWNPWLNRIREEQA